MRQKKLKNSIVFGALVLTGIVQSALACTDVNIQAKNGAVVAGRTMEWAYEMKWQLLYYPKGSKFKLSSPSGSNLPSREMTGKYDVLGIGSGLAGNTLLEGQNSEGLGLSGNFLPGYTEYETVTKQDKNYMSILEFGRFILANYKSVADVEKDVTKYKVFGADVPGIPVKPTVHYLITDRTGNSIVIEFINGQMKIFDKSIGVMTNAPNYDWHLTNIRNYVNLTSSGGNVAKVSSLGDVTGFSQGTSSFGLPGDYTSPSRFVRTTFLKYYSTQPNDAKGAVNLVDHILNTVDIPIGVVSDKQGSNTYNDYTQWIAVKDLQNNQLNFSDYTHRSNFIVVDMTKLAGQKEIVYPINKLIYPNNDITSSLMK
ncbi:linear amide C-N hydrolase [Aquella oligotrophica]|uniref:Choloylglycine hydrolase n=1 Tax=Aquella oligotrophica TaxID=2067065 RepID=A0A2I7N8C7_9NEIS|nr:choloylglycine hydrolase family protein [Aquella oligotrophica]AUR52690.1 choloylglycine hydrolase [Aquella oligotrophica]